MVMIRSERAIFGKMYRTILLGPTENPIFSASSSYRNLKIKEV